MVKMLVKKETLFCEYFHNHHNKFAHLIIPLLHNGKMNCAQQYKQNNYKIKIAQVSQVHSIHKQSALQQTIPFYIA